MAGASERPMSALRFVWMRNTATKPSSDPTTMEPTASKAALPVSFVMLRHAAATTSPSTAAPSSQTTEVEVGSIPRRMYSLR